VAQQLQATGLLPPPADLAALDVQGATSLLAELCATAPARAVILLIDNAQMLTATRPPWPRSRAWLRTLRQWEQQIDNLALTFVAQKGRAVRTRLALGMGLRRAAEVRPLFVPLLSELAVAAALRRQFEPFGVQVDDGAAARVYRLTGGHPKLTAELGERLMQRYNWQRRLPDAVPIIGAGLVNAAAGDPPYRGCVRAYGEALVDKLGRDIDSNRAWVLWRIGRVNVQEKTATADAFAGLTGAEAADIYNEWLAREVIDVRNGPTGPEYWLRSLSFARWVVHLHAPKFPPPQTPPPTTPPPASAPPASAPPASAPPATP
jgi:hypothetical protein